MVTRLFNAVFGAWPAGLAFAHAQPAAVPAAGPAPLYNATQEPDDPKVARRHDVDLTHIPRPRLSLLARPAFHLAVLASLLMWALIIAAILYLNR